MEFRAENAGLAAAIAIRDLERCEPYSEWRRLLAKGGDVSKPGWTLLYSIAGEIGVNTSALVKLYGQLGVLAVLDSSEGRRLITTTSLVGEEDWIR
jgi:hypothetical protein